MYMLKAFVVQIVIAVFLWGMPAGTSARTLLAPKVDSGPVIDGDGADAQWKLASRVVTRDKIAGIEVSLSAVYTDRKIFFLVDFPDPEPSTIHKAWQWDSEKKIYLMGPTREDVFVLKWNLEPNPVDLSIFADNAYRADIWFWKACRTDPVGFADDKHQSLHTEPFDGARQIMSKSKHPRYLIRSGDQGKAAYVTKIFTDNQGETVPRFENIIPTGSRADIRAKGRWADGRWTIEFSRALDTGHDDDIQFKPGGTYQFGISRYEIAGRARDPHAFQPLFGTGDTGEILYLKFVP